jgi:putative transposase
MGIVRLKAEVPANYWYDILLGCAPSLPIIVRRFPAEIISHSVWLYFRFALSFRDVDDVSPARRRPHLENHSRMVLQVRPDSCQRLTTEISAPGDKWYLDEVFLEINGSIHYLWRAVDQDDEGFDIMVQSRRDKRAANSFASY